MTVPSMDEAFDLMRDLVNKFTEYKGENDLANHLLLVACSAEMIAAKTPHLNSKKAYIFGLLHDYGKIISEEATHTFHGLTGYELMNEKGYDEVAQICLTHSFTTLDFNIDDYSYDKAGLAAAKKLIRDVVITDYDLLIQLCDLLVKGVGFSNIKDRIRNIQETYGVSTLLAKKKYHRALKLKKYFDNLTGSDIYKILGIN